MARAGGDLSGWLVVAGVAGVAAATVIACAPDAAPGEVDASLTAALADVWPQVLSPALDNAEAATAALADAAAAWDAAEGDPTALPAAQQAWLEAMGAWQHVELLQLGPTASSLSAVGGQDLRDEIYSWPTVNHCRVDQETVEADWDDPAFFDVNLVNVYGLDALEVLLFGPDANDCPSQLDINADGTWDALGPDGVARNRAAYAAAVAAQLHADLGALRDAWDPAGGDFAGQLADAGGDSSAYESPESGLNAVFDALFYLETALKERKLGWALGTGDCGEDDCAPYLESPLAGSSDAWVIANLAGARALFTGGEGAGLDDVLVALGQESLSADVLAAMDDADAAAAALGAPVQEADAAALTALEDAVDVVVDLLASDVATVLALQVPSEAAGDLD
jgi:predicted lipoprotein